MNNLNPSEEHESVTRHEHVVLSILEEIEKNPQTSQRTFAKNMGVALGLVNSLVRRVVNKGYVKVKRINSRNIHYLLTPKGVYEKSRLTYRFIRRSFHYLSIYRQKTYELLAPYANDGISELVIFGSGEEAELAFLAIRELRMKVLAIVDPNRLGKHCVGFEIEGIGWLLEQERLELILVLHSFQVNGGFEYYKGKIQRKCDVKHVAYVEI